MAILVWALGTPAHASDPAAEAAAMTVLDAFLAAVNSRDVQALEAQLIFPHYRIASGEVAVLEKAGTRPDLFERFVAAEPGWDHSAWERREVIHSGPSKVHVDTRFIRYRANGEVIARFDSLYILTEQEGRWGIKARSSFAP
jgi:hypothetical protein